MRIIAVALACWPGSAAAHDGVVHRTPEAASLHAAPDTPFPIAIGGPFRLIDQRGRIRTEADPDGHLQLLFFGYANCAEICSAALPQMAGVAEALSARGVAVTPVMITVDPLRDTPAAMTTALAGISPRLVGLTGSPEALGAAYDAFSIETEKLLEAPGRGAVYAHGSLIYLLDGQGNLLTLVPPILPLGQVIELVAGYAARG